MADTLFLKFLNNPLTPNLLDAYISLPGLSRYDASDPVRIIAFLVGSGAVYAADDDSGEGYDGERMLK